MEGLDSNSPFDLIAIVMMFMMFLAWFMYVAFPIMVTWLMMWIVDGIIWTVGHNFDYPILELFAYVYAILIIGTTAMQLITRRK